MAEKSVKNRWSRVALLGIGAALAGISFGAGASAVPINFDSAPFREVGRYDRLGAFRDVSLRITATTTEVIQALPSFRSLPTSFQNAVRRIGDALTIYEAASNVSTIYNVSQAQSVRELADVFASHSTASQAAALDSISGQIAMARTAVQGITTEIPTADVCLGVVLDAEFRADVQRALGSTDQLFGGSADYVSIDS